MAVFKAGQAVSNGWKRLIGMRAVRLRAHSTNTGRMLPETRIDCEQLPRLCAPDVCNVWLPEIEDKYNFDPQNEDHDKVMH